MGPLQTNGEWVSNEPPLRSRLAEQQLEHKEQKTKISLFIHSPISEETESFCVINSRLKMVHKVNELNNNLG